MTPFSSKWKYQKLAAVLPAELHVISRCYFVEDGKAMYKDYNAHAQLLFCP